MKEELIKQISDEINGEKLLFESRVEYTSSEKELMRNAVINRLSTDPNYLFYAFGYFNKLIDVCQIGPSSKVDVLINMAYVHEKRNNHVTEQKSVNDYAKFLCNEHYGTPIEETYPSMIKKIMPIDKIDGVCKRNISYFNNNIDFIITNNFLFEKYPEFFDDEYIEQLLGIVTTKEKCIMFTKEQKKELKHAKNILLNNINKYKENRLSKVKSKKL